MPWSRYDVFLSYSRADSKSVQPLLDELHRLGYRVFFDAQSIPFSEKWKEVLESSIRASRTLVLCWSESSRSSDYVSHEYHRAEAFNKPVFPWILDGTPLPPLLEVQAIKEPDGAKVARLLRPYLGWTLTRRRRARMLAAAAVAILIVAGLWIRFRPQPPPPPPPPWTFEGTIVCSNNRSKQLAGVRVVVTLDGKEYPASTNDQGYFKSPSLPPLPQPQPPFFQVTFEKDGYQPDDDEKVPTENLSTEKFVWPMRPLKNGCP
jgi:hypothetical protein